MTHIIHAVSHTFYNPSYCFELIKKRRLSNDASNISTNLPVSHIHIHMQKSVQANIVLDDQLWVSAVEFRKCFTKIMILIALCLQLSSQNCFLLLNSLTLEHTLTKQISCTIYKS